MTTLNLPYRRFVAQVSTGAPRSKSTYQALMAENLEALSACPWRDADDVPVTLTPHDFTLPSYFGDAYDAFKMTGAYNTGDMTEIGFAGMAAYRFAVPASALASGSEVALSSVSLPVSRDRFLRSGVHLGVELTDRATPSTDWATVRGTGDLAASGLSQATVANLLAGDVGSETLTIDLSGVAANPKAYLWVYVTLEDYLDSWAMYDAREKRLYAIEGSAMLVGGSVAVTFAGDVAADSSAAVTLLAGGSSPTWLQPLPTVNAGTAAPAVPEVPFAEYFFTAERTETTPIENSVSGKCLSFSGSGDFPFTITFVGKTVTSVVVRGVSLSPVTGTREWRGTYVGAITYNLYVSYVNFSDEDEPNYTRISYRVSVTPSPADGGSSSHTQGWNDSELYHYQTTRSYYYMLELVDGAPVAVDVVDNAPDPANRRNFESDVTVVTADTKWSVSMVTPTTTISFTVSKSGSAVTLYNSRNQVMGTWESDYSDSPTFFDAAVAAWLDNETAQNYGVAAALADFSAAVATFEAGTQPANAEVLGRLARMSRQGAAGMAYLHPKVGALGDELDVLRPVPRFFRTGSTPPTQTTCQPGLSAWYYRPSSGSAATTGLLWREGSATSGVAVSNPPFLQLALLALRAPRAFSNRIRISNGSGSAIHNGFALRFVAWRSPAANWDRSTSFALAAMASMPSVYRSDGDDAVAWEVDCSGALAPFASRTVSAMRLGASEIVSGDIADGTGIDIVLDEAVAEGDVVLIAPEVVGFADGVGGGSVYFGRQADPAGADASSHNFAWARYTENLGWFPTVTGS